LLNDNKNLKVYIDTCILSKLVWHSTEEEQQKSLDKICDYDCIDFVTSPITLEEFNKTKQAHIRVGLKVFYKLINKIPNAKFTKTEGGLTFPIKFPISFGTIIEEDLYKKIKKIFKKRDILHIYNAIKGNCNYFLTSDNKTILNKLKNNKTLAELKEICPDMEFVDPNTLLKKIK